MHQRPHVNKIMAIGIVILAGSILALLILGTKKNIVRDAHRQGGETHHDELHEKGPHGGRLLSNNNFQIEITIFETGVPPQFRVFAYEMGKEIAIDEVALIIELHRLGGRIDVVQFHKEGNYLKGNKVVEEPHSFDVKVRAGWKGRNYYWEYAQIEGRVELSPEARESAGITIETAGPAQIKMIVELPGEVKLNADKMVHVVPRVSGLVTAIYKNLGEQVKHGETLAVIESRELVGLKSEYLASVKRAELAYATYERKERLWKQKILAGKEHLASKQALAEAEINLRAASQKLLALGLSQKDLDMLPDNTEGNLTHFEVRAHYDGVVIGKHISVGESVKEDSDIFDIADLSTIWVEVTVYAKDLKVIEVGQNVTVQSKSLGLETSGELTYLGPLIGKQTRTARGIVVVQNPEGNWRPGLFVTVAVIREESSVPIAISVDALQTFRNWSVVFVQYENMFEARPVKLGRSDGKRVEVLEGLSPGEKYVTQNSFILKAELEKADATHDH
ncbi:MAG: efflux RND transporter periplasmic adaptor subunit [Candidatus Brocadiaceae bacterium]|nr:efflux RND transporter periplasmic adaptor subunit [Candidatus Brocadiaceae bacterium]